MPKKPDPFRKHVEDLGNNKWKCLFCGNEYRGSAPRIRVHLAGIPGGGIKVCEKVDRHVKEEALQKIKGKGSMLDISTGGTTGEETERTVFGASQSVLPSDDASNPNDAQDSNRPECVSQQPSCYWSTRTGSASACPQDQFCLPPGDMPLENLDASQQPNLSNHRLDAVHGNEIASSLQQLPVYSPASIELRGLLELPIHIEAGREQQNARGLSSFPNELQGGDVLPTPLLSNKATISIPHCSNEQYLIFDKQFADGITTDSPLYSMDWPNHHHSSPEDLLESCDAILNTSEEIQMNGLHNPTVGSSLQFDSSLDVDGANCLQDCGQPCVEEVVPVRNNTSPTDTVQHLGQLPSSRDKGDGSNIHRFPSETLMDIDTSTASQHTSDSQIFEATTVDSPVPQASTNTIGPSSSQSMSGLIYIPIMVTLDP
ncbi:hypothetical protein BT93_B0275 [Corymbia citriodora subsp. variegata]|nr:hypothetical protein BT93_B0275 [Corymbia citriodora subsp. variegata]